MDLILNEALADNSDEDEHSFDTKKRAFEPGEGSDFDSCSMLRISGSLLHMQRTHFCSCGEIERIERKNAL